MNDLFGDVRFGWKQLRKDRGFMAAALLTLALCIGANAAIFSVIHSVLLRPLPYPRSEALVTLHNSYPGAGVPRASTSVPDYFDRQEMEALAISALYQNRGVTIGESGTPERVLALRVTPTFFPLLGVSPALGRTFTEEEGESGNERRAVISHALWQQTYGGARDVVDKEIRIDGEQHTIVGVMPHTFLFGDADIRLWVPIAFTEQQKSDDARHSNSVGMIGRLRRGATVELAQAQVDELNRRNDERFPQFSEILRNAGFRTVVVGYREDLTREASATLYLLQGGVLLVLLIGCVNIANLILVRSTVRARELTTRFALGAGRWRIIRQLLTESVLLAVVGGVLGLAAGYLGMRLIVALAAEQLPRAAEIGMYPPVMASTLALSLLAGILFGTIPVLRVFRADLSTVFRQESRTGTTGRAALTARSALVVTQVSLAFALLVGAALLLVSFGRKLNVDPGFQAEGVGTASLAFPTSRYDGTARRALAGRLLERIRALPGVTEAGMTSTIPFGSDNNNSVITPEGYVPQPGESPLSPAQSVVTPGYFEAMRVPIVRGRSFDTRDTEDAPRVVIIDEWLANRYWPGQDPLGKRLFQGIPEALTGGEEITWRTIVGVVKEIRLANLAGNEQVGHYYYPYDQDAYTGVYLAVRTTRDPATIMAAVRREVAALDPDLPLYGVQTMSERVSGSLLPDRARMTLLLIFAGVALLLAATGIYGVLAYSVALRTREIGIRVALGSQARQIFGLVLGHGLRLLALGLFIGAGGSLLMARVIRSMLYGVGPNDPAVFAGVFVVLSAVALVACVLPARRAMRVNPVAALTYE